MQYPLRFEFHDLIMGDGWVAGVVTDGRALLYQEDDGAWWLSGVNPGALAAGGEKQSDAYRAFKEAYRSVLIDAAAKANSYEAFRSEAERFFGEVCAQTEAEWLAAVENVRKGSLALEGLGRKSADEPPTVTVCLLDQPKASENVVRELEYAEAA